MRIIDLINELDGAGLVVTDDKALEIAVEEMGLTMESPVDVNAELLESLEGYERMTKAILDMGVVDISQLKSALAFILPATQAIIAKIEN